ncbi:ribonuclease E/G, partial [Cribrihabitans sp. XS_ASV171]
LIVIDFIDMDERKNNAAVEKRVKERLKTDRARIQVGRISGFGLMEMSRQRLRPGMIEATTQPCPACHGTGLIRSDDNMALSILRQIEEEGTRRRSREVLVRCPVTIANYLMNQKREHIAQIEARYGLSVRIEGDMHLVSPDFSMEKFKTASRTVPEATAPVVSVDTSLMDQIDADEEASSEEEAPAAPVSDEDNKPKRKRRRRRKKKNGSNGNGEQADGQDSQPSREDASTSEAEENSSDEAHSETPDSQNAGEAEAEGETKPKRRRAPRRRKSKPAETESGEGQVAAEEAASAAKPQQDASAPAESAGDVSTVDATGDTAPETQTRVPAKPAEAETSEEGLEQAEPVVTVPADSEPAQPVPDPEIPAEVAENAPETEIETPGIPQDVPAAPEEPENNEAAEQQQPA